MRRDASNCGKKGLVMTWIDAKERKPEALRQVLVFGPDIGTNDGFWDGSMWNGEKILDGDEITHWMPLPEGPGKGILKATEEVFIQARLISPEPFPWGYCCAPGALAEARKFMADPPDWPGPDREFRIVKRTTIEEVIE